VDTVVVIASTHKREAPYLVDIAGEALVDRTTRQVRETGAKVVVFTAPAQRATLEALATVDSWDGERITLLRGDVVWPVDVLSAILGDGDSPKFYGNFCNVFGMGFAQEDKGRVIAALERADLDASRRLESGGGGWWQFYNAVSDFEDLRARQWGPIFKTIPSVGTPSGAWTQRLHRKGQYYAFLEAHPWARSADNWPHNGKSTLDVCVTGTGRCGTGYFSRLLSLVGLACGHEEIFSLGGLERAKVNLWNKPHLVADSSWLAAPFLSSLMLQDAIIVHLVRHPRLVIESAVRKGAFASPNIRGYSEYSVTHLPDLGEYVEDPASAEAFRYVHWNALIEREAAGRRILHRVEDGYRALLKALGVAHSFLGQVAENTTYNTSGPHEERLKWDSIHSSIRPALQETMRGYGYNEW